MTWIGLALAACLGAADEPAPRIPVAKPVRTDLKRVASMLAGNVAADAEAPLFARVPGYVASVAVDIGDRVAAGQILLQLSVPDLQAAHAAKQAAERQAAAEAALAEAGIASAKADEASAAAKIGAAKAAVARTVAEVQRWRSEAGRAEELARTSAVTPKLADEAAQQRDGAIAGEQEAQAIVVAAEALRGAATARVAQAAAAAAAARAKQEAAGAEVRLAAAWLEFAAVRTPFAGVVTARNVDPGHLVAANLPSGAPLLVVVRTDPVRVRFDVPEAEARFVKPGTAVELAFPGAGVAKRSAKVARAAWSLHPGARTLRAEADLPNADGALRPGMYVLATATLEERAKALAVPAAALASDPEPHVFVLRDGAARKQRVKPGIAAGGLVEIAEGLAPEDEVVQSVAAGVLDGQTIDPVRPAPPK